MDIEHNICGNLVWNWLHIMVIVRNICRSLYGTGFMSRLLSLIFVGPCMNRFHVTLIEPNICGSLVLNWFYITVKEPNICRSSVWKWLHVTITEPNICTFLYGTSFVSRL